MSDVDQPRNSEGGGAPPSASLWEALLARLREAAAPRFEVERLLGFGGMAGVYLAHEAKLDRKVAIKVMSPSLMMDPGLVERFRQEARTIARLGHPNIITVYDVVEQQDLHYFVMAYVPGKTVGHVMQEIGGPLPTEVVRSWMFQIGSALDYAHGAGVVHRDVKPGNILLDEKGNALVTDFGIAKVADQEGLTRTGMLVGTPAYMSPEQCSSLEVGPGSDQYSLGALAYQMVTGSPPFSGPTLAVLHAHVGQRPEPVRTIQPDCPAELASVIDRMLAKRPRERWPSLGEALEEMGAAAVPLRGPVRHRLVDLAAPVEKVTVSSPRGVQRPPVPSVEVEAGETFLVQAVVTGPGGRVLSGRRVRWDSEAPAVAQVMPDGRVLTLGAGTARITGECGGCRDSVTFQVGSARDALHRAPRRELQAGGSVDLAEVLPLDDLAATPAERGWGSTRPEVARISPDGRVEALRPGTATLTAFGSGRALVVEIEVTPALGEVDAGAAARASTPIPASRTLAPDIVDARPVNPQQPTPTRTGAPSPGAGRRRTPAAFAAASLAALLLAGGYLLFDSSGGQPGEMGDVATPPAEPSAEPAAVEGEAGPPAAGEEAAADAEAAPPGGQVEDVGETVPPETATDPPPSTPSEATGRSGTVRLGELPDGARAAVVVEGGEVAVEPGREISLPAGTYDTRVEAPGYEAYRGQLVVVAEGTTDWHPGLLAESDPEAEEPDGERAEAEVLEAAARAEAEARAGIETLIAEFARSFETRDMDRVLAFFLESPGGWADQWRPLVEDTRNASELSAEVRDLRDLELGSADRGSAAFSVGLRYRDFRNSLQEPVLQFTAQVERLNGEWRFRELTKRR